LSDADADCCDLPLTFDPDSGSTIDSGASYSEISEQIDDALLDFADITDKFLRVARTKDGIPDQLPRSVPRDLSTPINVNDWSR
jgi:hypothetical protein